MRASTGVLVASSAGVCALALMPWQDWTLPLAQRVDDMVDRLSLSDQILQTWSIAPPMNLSGVVLPAYNYRSNCVHGWAASGGTWKANETWTNFPAPLGLGAMFDATLMRTVGEVTSTEGRALHNLGLAQNGGASTEARGLNCFAPNVNILRHMLYGRNQELQSEDPVHLSGMATSYLKGIQVGEAPQYLKVAGCLKHYAIHDGPESDPISREAFMANISLWQAWANYLPQFRAGVLAGAASVMCAYSATNFSNGAPNCASDWLLGTVLRGALGFGDAQVISDNGALQMIYDKPPNGHNWVPDAVHAAAAAINAGTDNDLGHDSIFSGNLQAAIDAGLTTPATVRRAARRNLLMRFRLGEFDPSYLVPYQAYGAESLDTPPHRALNLQAARESIVLLKNGGAGGAWSGGGAAAVLPLILTATTTLALIGPTADDGNVLLGNYAGRPGVTITVKDGLQAALTATGGTLNYAPGCTGQLCPDTSGFADALQAAQGADAIVFVGGLTQSLSSEGHDWDSNSACNGVAGVPGTLPGCQLPLLQALREAHPTTPLIVVGVAGNPLYQPWELANASALLFSAYPGNMGGQAIAEVVTGAFTPGGRLPFTIPNPIPDIKLLADNDFTAGPGISYRYLKDPSAVMHPFAYGLSYTTFAYSSLTLAGLGGQGLAPCTPLTVSVNVTNTGTTVGDEVVQVYVGYPAGWDSTFTVPRPCLRGFARVTLPPGVTTTVTLALPTDSTTLVDSSGFRQFVPGSFTLYVGGQQPGYAALGPGKSTGAPEPLSTAFTVPGTGTTPFATCPGATQ